MTLTRIPFEATYTPTWRHPSNGFHLGFTSLQGVSRSYEGVWFSAYPKAQKVLSRFFSGGFGFAVR